MGGPGAHPNSGRRAPLKSPPPKQSVIRLAALNRVPPPFFAFLLVTVVTYLGLVEVVTRWFYRRYAM